MKLRKYMATVSQIFELKEGEIEWLARHLTHDIRVHREFYRLHDSSVELAKVSKLLLAVESGKPGSWKGCKLDEINLEMIGLTENKMGLSDDSDNEKAVNTKSRPSAAWCLPSSQTVTTTDTSMLTDDYEYEEAASTESRSPSAQHSQLSSPACSTGKKIAPMGNDNDKGNDKYHIHVCHHLRVRKSIKAHFKTLPKQSLAHRYYNAITLLLAVVVVSDVNVMSSTVAADQLLSC